MNKTILQVPISKELKDKAEEASAKQGFSSLQESVRIFLAQLSQGNLKISFENIYFCHFWIRFSNLNCCCWNNRREIHSDTVY